MQLKEFVPCFFLIKREATFDLLYIIESTYNRKRKLTDLGSRNIAIAKITFIRTKSIYVYWICNSKIPFFKDSRLFSFLFLFFSLNIQLNYNTQIFKDCVSNFVSRFISLSFSLKAAEANKKFLYDKKKKL